MKKKKKKNAIDERMTWNGNLKKKNMKKQNKNERGKKRWKILSQVKETEERCKKKFIKSTWGAYTPQVVNLNISWGVS